MANLLSNTTIGGYQSIHTGNIGSYALTSLPSHNHDDRYFTETESDGRFQPLENQRVSTGNSVTFSQVYTNNWFRNNSINTGLYQEAGGGNHWYAEDSNIWTIGANGSYPQIRFRSGGHQGTIRGYVYADTENTIGFLNNAGSWSLRTNSSRDTQIFGTLTVGSSGSSDIYMTDTDETTRRIHTNSGRIGFLNSSSNWGAYCDNTGNWFSDHSMRAPIFYDSQDTGYYVDPNSTSNINNLSVVGYQSIGGQTSNGQSNYQWDGATYRNPDQWTARLILRRDNATTGINGSIPSLVIFNNNGADQTTASMVFATNECVTGSNSVNLAGIIAKKESVGNCGGWSSGSLNFFVKNFGARVDSLALTPDGNATFSGIVYSTGYGDSTQWNTAYSWGNHASAGYLTSYTETDTLASVTGRGASTSTNISVNTINIGTDATYGGAYRSVSFGYNGDGSNRIFAANNTSDGMYFTAATGQGFNFRPNGGTANLVVINSAGNIGIGTNSPGELLHMKSSAPVIRQEKTGILNWYSGNVTGNNYTIYPDSATNAVFNITSVGNVGIGTTSPTTKLEVIGSTSNVNGYADGTIQVTSLSPIAFVATSNLNPSLNRWGFKLREVNEGDFSIYDYRNSANRLLINSSGNVGIGVTSPGVRLDVSGDIRASNVLYGSSAFVNMIRMNGGTELPFRNSSNVEVMRITSAGNVGIGTTTPAAKLNISGNLGSTIGGGNSAIKMTNTDTGNFASISAGIVGITNSGMEFSIDGSRAMVISGSGNVGIGTTSPSYKLHVEGTIYSPVYTSGNITINAGDFLFSADGGGDGFQMDYYNGQMYLGNNAGTSWHMVMQDNGNIGIGTTSPAYKLDVNGSINASGSLRTSDNVFTNYIRDISGVKYISLDGTGIKLEPAGYGQTVLQAVSTGVNITGNVGIGTTSPVGSLDIYGTTGLKVRIGYFTDQGTDDPTLRMFDGKGTRPAYSFTSDNTSGMFGGSGFTAFATSATEKMRITSGGNVGIGTAQPVGQLNIFGGTGNNPAILTLQSQSGGSGLTGIYFRPYQNVTFANTAPAQASILAIDSSYSAHITFSTKVPGAGTNSLTERMRLTSTGSLLIGSTTDTGEALQVTGSIKSTALSTNGPVVASGGVLTSVTGYTGMVTIQQAPPMPPVTFDIQNGIIVNVM